MATVEPIRKHREIEHAWRRHDPRQGRVPLAAKKRLAEIKRALAPAAGVIERHLYGGEGFPDHLLTDCVLKRGARLHRDAPQGKVLGSRTAHRRPH